MLATSPAPKYHDLDSNLWTQHKDFVHVATDYVSEKPDKAAKAAYLAIDWLRWGDAVSRDDQLANTIHYHSKCFKLFHTGPVKFVKYLCSGKPRDNSVHYATTRMFEDPSMYNIGQEVRSLNGLIGPAYDTADLAAKGFFPLMEKGQLEMFKGVNGASLAIAMGWNVIDTLTEIGSKPTEAKMAEKANKEFFGLMANISYFVLGVFSALSVFFNVVYTPITFTILSTSNLFFGMIDYFQKHLGEQIKPYTEEII